MRLASPEKQRSAAGKRDHSKQVARAAKGMGHDTGMDLGPPEIIMILVIVLVLFGSTKIPKLARSLGEASKEFKKGIEEGQGVEKQPVTAPSVRIEAEVASTLAPSIAVPAAVVDAVSERPDTSD